MEHNKTVLLDNLNAKIKAKHYAVDKTSLNIHRILIIHRPPLSHSLLEQLTLYVVTVAGITFLVLLQVRFVLLNTVMT